MSDSAAYGELWNQKEIRDAKREAWSATYAAAVGTLLAKPEYQLVDGEDDEARDDRRTTQVTVSRLAAEAAEWAATQMEDAINFGALSEAG